DWNAVRELALAARAGRSVVLFGAIAARLLAEPGAPSVVVLWLRWAIAPHRLAMLPLVRRAVAERRTAAEAAPPEPQTPPEHPRAWDRALAAHAQLLQSDPAKLGGEALARLGIAWDGAMADRTEHRHLAERAFVLGVSSERGALEKIGRAVEGDIA